MRRELLITILLIWSCLSMQAIDFYIAGDGRPGNGWCCEMFWNPSGCKMADGDTYTANLQEGTYSFKITTGSWGNSLGYTSLDVANSIECSTNQDNNIIFTISKPSKVTVKLSTRGISVQTAETETTEHCTPASGTLPVMYIFTENGAEITSKDVYLSASFYIDAENTSAYESLGSPEAMIETQIKGRGNYTWTGFDKKPYRLKLKAKNSLLGMNKSKHFTLLAHADDKFAFLRNTLGFECSRLFGLEYTPAQEPLELFINGDYKGIYFLTEQIRIDKDRVNITEQAEEETDPYNITGGWLLEIDNYWEDKSIQFQMKEKGDDWLLVTSKSPEVMSDEQYQYMENYLYNTNKAIQDKGDWQKYIDLESLVNFYLVNEVMGNHEAFHGSCYMHKERGTDTKLVFGPVWDFGSSLGWSDHIYDSPLWGDVWIDDLAQTSAFQEQATKRWLEVRGVLYPRLKDKADAFISQIKPAAACDCNRWSQYGNRGVETTKQKALDYLRERMEWLDTYWGTTGASEMLEDSGTGVYVYPNPSRGNINLVGAEGVLEVYILDLGGRKVCELDASLRRWELSLEDGMYIMCVVTAHGDANKLHYFRIFLNKN